MYEKLVKEYGWDGAIRYLWEGEPYTPKIQRLLDAIAEAEKNRISEEHLINDTEEALERARLDSVDDLRTTKMIVRKWIENHKPANLEKDLAGLSSRLDKLAAKVDAVIISQAEADGNSRVIDDIKRRKKLLSKQLVIDMERCDALMMSYQVLQE